MISRPRQTSDKIEVQDFIAANFTPYPGDVSFLCPPTARTKAIWEQVKEMLAQEAQKGVLGVDTQTPSTIISHGPGYIDKDKELIVGLQTDKPLVRAIKPNGGIRIVQKAAADYGYQLPAELVEFYSKHHRTHNDGVFAAYSSEHKLLRSKHIITGLPDNYARGRIIGDYRRVALYGTSQLIAAKTADLEEILTTGSSTVAENIRSREEIADQISALKQLEMMGQSYGCDLTHPAKGFLEAVQWTYLAYLAAVKQQDGAAMSIGRLDAFFDIYANKDLKSGLLDESQVQEIIDDFVIKLRLVRHLRPVEYNQIFAGDPTWVTLALGGSLVGTKKSQNGTNKSLVTKTSFRFLQTLRNLGPSAEPNLTVLWSPFASEHWQRFCTQISIETSSIQYENDELMKPYFGSDYGIACCVSAMRLGKDMQFFGARANLAKLLLLAINGGKEEPLLLDSDETNDLGGERIIPGLKALNESEFLDYEQVWPRLVKLMDWLAERYVGAMNVIHYSHDRYNYESLEMALHDTDVRRLMAFGLAGLSIVADSLSAIKYAQVKPKWNSAGVAESYEVSGDFPKYGNDDERVDQIAVQIVQEFSKALKRYKTYRNAEHTLSILTITSNVMYGKLTGATPDGRKSGVPFAPGANPMPGSETKGALAALNSVAKLPYSACLDGISNTFSIVPDSLGKDASSRESNLMQILAGYFANQGGHHLNINVLTPELLIDAKLHPESYPQLTIRVSGYAVLFAKLSAEQQDEVISRTFHRHV